MAKKPKWLQAANVMIDDETGALLVEVETEIPAADVQTIVEGLSGGAGGEPGVGGKTLKDVASAISAAKSKVGGGAKTVTTHGTPEPLAAATLACKLILVQPARNDDGTPANTKIVKLGDAAGLSIIVCPGDGGYFIPAADAHLVLLDSLVDGEGVTWTAFN